MRSIISGFEYWALSLTEVPEQFHFTSPASRLIFEAVVDKMEGGIEKDCTALGGLFQTIISDMRVSIES